MRHTDRWPGLSAREGIGWGVLGRERLGQEVEVFEREELIGREELIEREELIGREEGFGQEEVVWGEGEGIEREEGFGQAVLGRQSEKYLKTSL